VAGQLGALVGEEQQSTLDELTRSGGGGPMESNGTMVADDSGKRIGCLLSRTLAHLFSPRVA